MAVPSFCQESSEECRDMARVLLLWGPQYGRDYGAKSLLSSLVTDIPERQGVVEAA